MFDVCHQSLYVLKYAQLVCTYSKSTHTDRYLDFRSCHPISQKRGVIKTLMKRLSPIVSDEKLLEQEQQQI